MNFNHKQLNDSKNKMRECRRSYLDSCHTKESEVKRYGRDEYFLADGNVIWIPEYLYKVTYFKKYMLKCSRDSSTIFR